MTAAPNPLLVIPRMKMTPTLTLHPPTPPSPPRARSLASYVWMYGVYTLVVLAGYMIHTLRDGSSARGFDDKGETACTGWGDLH